MKRLLLLVLLFSARVVSAQTVATFASTVTDPNAAAPLSSASYTPACGQAFAAQSSPLTNVTEGRYPDPANAALDCVVTLQAQMAALPSGSYKAALKVGALFGPLSSTFTAAQVTDPCAGTPATAGAAFVGTRTFGWCVDGKDTNGNPAAYTGWAVYLDNVRTVVVGTAQGTGTSGLTFYTAPLAVAAGVHSVQVAAVNAVAESAKSGTFTVTVSMPASAPTAPVFRSVN